MRKPGNPAKPGEARRKGRPNKTTAALKDMIIGALSAVGGQDYLQEQAILNPVAFMVLLGKILPKDMSVDNKSTDGSMSPKPVRIIDKEYFKEIMKELDEEC